MTKITYGNGVVTDYSYNPQTLRLDSLRTTNSALQTLQDFRYTVDPTGTVSAITDRVHTGTQSFTYDPLNRLTSATGAYGTGTYAYDPLGNLTSKEGVTRTYPVAGAARPHAVTGLADGTTLSYDANGNLKTKVQSGATLATYTWDAENRLTQVQQVPPETTVSVTLQAGWNFVALPVDPADHSIAAILGSAASSVSQMSRVAPSPQPPAPSQWEHWVNDATFNQFTTLEPGTGYQVYCTAPVTLTVRGKPIAGVSKSLAAGWHLLGATNGTGTLTLASWLTGVSATQVKKLDPATGTLTTATQAEAGQSYWVQLGTAGTWTPPAPPDQLTQFVYDGDGGRVKQVTSSGTTTYLGESYEKAPSGTTTKYVFAGSQRIAAKDSTGALRFYHGDHLGSSNVITDSTGALVELAEYTPFGSLARQEGSANVAQKFTGQRLDSTGLYFYNARYYDPALGRFLSPDPFIQNPADPQTLNRYSYCRNNPINLVDPSGYGWFRRLVAAVVAVFVAVVVTIATDGCIPCGAAAGGSTYVAISGSGTGSSSSNTSSSSPSAAPAPPLSPALGPGSAPLGLQPVTGPPAYTGAALPILGVLAIPSDPSDAILWPALLIGGTAYVAAKYGAPALKQALDDAVNQPTRQDQTVVGYHATSAANAQSILDQGFKLSRSDLGGRNRFGPGYSLANTPNHAAAEYLSRNGRPPEAILQVQARLTKNLKVGGPLAERPISRWIGAVARAAGGSITYGAFAPGAEGGINYVLFDPANQVVQQDRIQ